MKLNLATIVAACVAGLLQTTLAQTQLVTNGGFETPNAGEWNISGPGASLKSSAGLAHTGSSYLGLGSAASQQFVYQLITIPTNTVAALLSYYYDVYSPSLNSSDSLTVAIVQTNGTVSSIVDQKTGANSTGLGTAFYQQNTFDLTPYAGQTIRIEFVASGATTSFNIDDVSALVETTADIPANDNFTNRTVLIGASATVIANNTFASKEP